MLLIFRVPLFATCATVGATAVHPLARQFRRADGVTGYRFGGRGGGRCGGAGSQVCLLEHLEIVFDVALLELPGGERLADGSDGAIVGVLTDRYFGGDYFGCPLEGAGGRVDAAVELWTENNRSV